MNQIENNSTVVDGTVGTVVNVKVKYIRPMHDNLREWMADEQNIYIGRSGIVFIDKRRYPEKNSTWANPFKVSKFGRTGCLIKYEVYVQEMIKKHGIQWLEPLIGKTLGCWCKPDSCHGDILLKYIPLKDTA
jgi:hypothetical protein